MGGRAPWIAGFAWGGVFAILVFALPVVGIPALAGSLGLGLIVAVHQRRSAFLSGELVGLGATWLIASAIVWRACELAASCEEVTIALPFGALAMTILVVGVVVLRFGRRA